MLCAIAYTHLSLQGLGVKINKLGIKSPAFRLALMAVLTEDKYTEAAMALSIKIRARKNTPLQEAAGGR